MIPKSSLEYFLQKEKSEALYLQALSQTGLARSDTSVQAF